MAKNKEARNVINKEKVFTEYPKKVEDPDGAFVLAKNKVQEDCIKKGNPFPVEETKPKVEKKGPAEYPKSIEVTIEDDEGEETTERRIVRCKDEEHAVLNGKKWVPAEDTAVAPKKKSDGPAEYPKVVIIDGERHRVRNKAEEEALGEEPGDKGDDVVDLSKMNKDALENYAKEHFEVDLDKRKTKKDLIAEIEALAEIEVDLEEMGETQLVEFAKENYELELDIEDGKEALIEAIVGAADEDDLGLGD